MHTILSLFDTGNRIWHKVINTINTGYSCEDKVSHAGSLLLSGINSLKKLRVIEVI